MEPVAIGELLEKGEGKRDAIHIAIAPVTADLKTDDILLPGHHVGFTRENNTDMVGLDTGEFVGIVDPFLDREIHDGERFYLFLYPNTITSLRHVWTHPAFKVQAPRGDND